MCLIYIVDGSIDLESAMKKKKKKKKAFNLEELDGALPEPGIGGKAKEDSVIETIDGADENAVEVSNWENWISYIYL